MDGFFDMDKEDPTMELLKTNMHAYSEFFVIFHLTDKSNPAAGISALMFVTRDYASCISEWALKTKEASNPSGRNFVVLRGRVDHPTLSEWLQKTSNMEFTQPESMFAGDSGGVTSDWEQVGTDGVNSPDIPEDVYKTALFASGKGRCKKYDRWRSWSGNIVKGFEDQYNVGVDMVYARNKTWETAFANSNFEE